jgi:amidohydrolase
MNDSELLKKLIFWRRTIHQYPELGNHEFKTADFIEKNLKQLKIPFKRLTKTGIAAVLNNPKSAIRNPQSKCIALRADMDALPLHEKNPSPYRSKNPGVMHACGHDAHVAMLLGAATLLAEKKDLNGTVKLLFQPNEEGAGGALDLIQKGVMKNPKVHAVFGLHVNPRLPAGTIGIKEGPLMAAVDKFTIEIIGKGGHAAYPHEGRDPIPVTAEIIQALQTILSRKIDPVEPAVVTIGTIQGGSRYNILAEKVTLTGTVRTLSESVHAKIPKIMREVLAGICKAHGIAFKLQYDIIGSVLSNSESMTDFARKTAERIFEKSKLYPLKNPSMGGEDFAEYLKFSPGCFIYIGTGSKSNKGLIPWHHPEFDIEEYAMPVGSKLLAGIAEDFLK